MVELKVGDRVKRANSNRGTRGTRGTILDIRRESFYFSMNDLLVKNEPAMITVQFDNGTKSVFGPEGLELVKETK